jgi:hypothetical protein
MEQRERQSPALRIVRTWTELSTDPKVALVRCHETEDGRVFRYNEPAWEVLDPGPSKWKRFVKWLSKKFGMA